MQTRRQVRRLHGQDDSLLALVCGESRLLGCRQGQPALLLAPKGYLCVPVHVFGTGHDDSLRLCIRLAVELKSGGHFDREGGEEREGLRSDAGGGRGGGTG